MSYRKLLEEIEQLWAGSPPDHAPERKFLLWHHNHFLPFADRMRAELAALNDPTIRCANCKAVVQHRDEHWNDVDYSDVRENGIPDWSCE